MCSQLGHEPQISDVFAVVETTILLNRTFVLPPTNDLTKKATHHAFEPERLHLNVLI